MKVKQRHTVENRREFFRSLARYSTLGALAAASAFLLKRKASVRQAAHVCNERGICHNCSQVAGCMLPQAQSFRLTRVRTNKEPT